MYTVHKEVVLEASTTRVFDALTDPTQIVAYWPLTSVESSREVGGPIVIKGDTEAGPFTDHGVIEAFDRPRHFRYNYWSDNHGTQDTPANRMSIDYAISPVGDHSLLSVTHANLGTAERHALMTDAWDFLIAQLKEHVEQT